MTRLEWQDQFSTDQACRKYFLWIPKSLPLLEFYGHASELGTKQDPVVVGVSLTEQGHPLYTFLEAVPNLLEESVKEVVRRRVEDQGVWRTDGAAVYASAAEEHQAEHKVTLSTDPKAEVVFHWINIVISNAKTFIDGTYHGRGRARRQLYSCPPRPVLQP